MLDTTRSYFLIVIELVVFAVLLTFINFSVSQAYELRVLESNKESLKQELTLARSLYLYDGQEMTGDDVLLAVKKYTKIYDMYIELGEVDSDMWYPTATSSGVLGVDDPESTWNSDNLRSSLGSNITKSYMSTLVRDINDVVTGIRFERID